jgi:cytochrome c-type biogenesis protein CcmH/NrfG
VLEKLAKSAKGAEAPNAFYAWGLAASNSQNYDDAITAWKKFIVLAPPKDPRVAQAKQSIKALEIAKKAPKPEPASTTEDKE